MSNHERLVGTDKPVHHLTKKIELSDDNRADINNALEMAFDSVRYSMSWQPKIIRRKDVIPVEEPIRLDIPLGDDKSVGLELQSGALEVAWTSGQSQDECLIHFKSDDPNLPHLSIEQDGNLWTVSNLDQDNQTIATLSALDVISLVEQAAQQSQDCVLDGSWRDREHPGDKPHIARDIICNTALIGSVSSEQENVYGLQKPYISSSPDKAPAFLGHMDALLTVFENSDKTSVHMVANEPMLAIGGDNEFAGRLFSATRTTWKQSNIQTVRAHVSLRGTCEVSQLSEMLAHEDTDDALDILIGQAKSFAPPSKVS